jgi:uncharacterized membrane protein SirB2
MNSRPSWKSAWWGEKLIVVMVATLVTLSIIQFARGEDSQVAIMGYSTVALGCLNFALKFWRGRRQSDGPDQR